MLLCMTMILHAYDMYGRVNSLNRPPFWAEAPQLPIGSKTFDSGTRQCRLNGARAASWSKIRVKK